MATESTNTPHLQPGSQAGEVSEEIQFQAADGRQVVGAFFKPATADRGRAVLICGATGVPQRFYAPLAGWLAQQGVAVLTFDFRGIGRSLTEPHVRQCKARKQDWGQLDMPAALAWLRQRAGVEQVDVIGHSAGGQLIGLMPNHASIRRVAMVACSSGYVGRIGFPGRLAAEFFLRAWLPATSRLLGYAPLRVIRFGEDLPAGVAVQWGRWCRRPGYVANGFGREIERHYYDEFRAPILALRASDDRIATAANVQDLLRLFPKAPTETRTLDARSTGGSIGHVGFFRRAHSNLWPILTEWFDA
jgi:predicted alpha/beta hydrolase